MGFRLGRTGPSGFAFCADFSYADEKLDIAVPIPPPRSGGGGAGMETCGSSTGRDRRPVARETLNRLDMLSILLPPQCVLPGGRSRSPHLVALVDVSIRIDGRPCRWRARCEQSTEPTAKPASCAARGGCGFGYPTENPTETTATETACYRGCWCRGNGCRGCGCNVCDGCQIRCSDRGWTRPSVCRSGCVEPIHECVRHGARLWGWSASPTLS